LSLNCSTMGCNCTHNCELDVARLARMGQGSMRLRDSVDTADREETEEMEEMEETEDKGDKGDKGDREAVKELSAPSRIQRCASPRGAGCGSRQATPGRTRVRARLDQFPVYCPGQAAVRSCRRRRRLPPPGLAICRPPLQADKALSKVNLGCR
jgi:hypothetical protein